MNNFDFLPAEILTHIISYTNAPTLASVCQVNSRLHGVVHNNLPSLDFPALKLDATIRFVQSTIPKNAFDGLKAQLQEEPFSQEAKDMIFHNHSERSKVAQMTTASKIAKILSLKELFTWQKLIVHPRLAIFQKIFVELAGSQAIRKNEILMTLLQNLSTNQILESPPEMVIPTSEDPQKQRAIDFTTNQIVLGIELTQKAVEQELAPLKTMLSEERFGILVSQFTKQALHLLYEAVPRISKELTIEDMDQLDTLASSPLQLKMNQLTLELTPMVSQLAQSLLVEITQQNMQHAEQLLLNTHI